MWTSRALRRTGTERTRSADFWRFAFGPKVHLYRYVTLMKSFM